MILSNIRVYDFEESLIASGYAMRTEVGNKTTIDAKDLKRGKLLTKLSLTNGAHAQWLTGVRVNFDVTFTNKAWVEAERYRFFEFVTSQSTMHRITKFDLGASYNEYVDSRMVEIMREKINTYNTLIAKEDIELSDEIKRLYLEILYSNPSGFKITARITTNYRCLLNMYLQRHDHRLPEWREFCKELLTLPYFKVLLEAYLNKEVTLDE